MPKQSIENKPPEKSKQAAELPLQGAGGSTMRRQQSAAPQVTLHTNLNTFPAGALCLQGE
jgi:hypothetical protein